MTAVSSALLRLDFRVGWLGSSRSEPPGTSLCGLAALDHDIMKERRKGSPGGDGVAAGARPYVFLAAFAALQENQAMTGAQTGDMLGQHGKLRLLTEALWCLAGSTP